MEDKRKCKSCKKEVNFADCKYFGNYSDDKKVWCGECWIDLQEWIKRKWFEEQIPILKEDANTFLEECERNKKQFINLIGQVKSYLTRLENLSTPKDIEKYSEQYELNKFEVNNGRKNIIETKS